MRYALLAFVLFVSPVHAGTNPPLLLQRPTVSARQVAFVYADDIWIVDRDGGDARRLTTGVGLESYPVFSPDGETIAFAGQYEGNLDVYVVPASGGVPRRLTSHPDPDVPVAWTPDGKAVIFRSPRTSYARMSQLFSVPAGGGQPTELPLPMGEDGALSPDGKRIAYVPFSNKPTYPGGYRPLRNYRGGTASPLWIAYLADSSITKVPRKDSNDFNPMWIGERVYFLSDRDGSTTLFAYEPDSKQVRRLLEPGKIDIKSASACRDAIVYDRFGTLHLFDLKTEKSKPISVRIAADLPSVRTKMEKVAKNIHKAGLSPSGARAVFEVRGEVLTVPAEKGDIRNLTNTSGSAERDPAWSPDGKSLAYLSDESGEYELHIRPQNGLGKVKKLKLGDPPSFYYNPTWSPDGKKIAYQDKRLNVWIIDVDTGKSIKVDTAPYDDDPPAPPVWSPDSKWLAFSRQLKNYLYAVFLYSVDSGKKRPRSDAQCLRGCLEQGRSISPGPRER
jgi:tricorn protease